MPDSALLFDTSSPRHARRTRRFTLRRCIGMSIPLIALATTLHPVSGVEHTIEPGDALWTIASTYGVSIDELVTANQLGDPDMIIAGRTLMVPTGTEAVESAGPAPGAAAQRSAAESHAVESGDTLWAIASRYDVPLGALARQNDIGGDALIFPGQLLELPRAATDEPDAAVESSVADTSPAVGFHTVAPGDSLWAISSRHNLSIDDLITANDIDRNAVLLPGQQLVVTPVPATLSNLPADLLDDPERLSLLPVFDVWAAEYGIPGDLLKALAWFESGWNNTKVSSADAIGIGQLLPITADFVGDILLGGAELDPTIPEQNIRLSARYLRYLLDNAGSVRLAVASYYQGLTATRQHGIYSSSEFYVDGILALRSRFS